MIPFQKIIAWFLIGLLSFEVIFRVPFSISDVAALESEDHEDIVSLLVEEDLFRKMSSDIDAYARRVQARLPHTRAVILTFPRDAHPYVIASANERLYFSGLPDHGNKTQKLVGTILIGHLPIPVVHKDNTSFLSLFPYTDFDEPHFFWNWDTSRYEFLSQKKEDPRPDIWHSVISPNTGNIDTDVTKIRGFFARVYEYDDKKWRYQNVGTDPQVLYMDSINESRAASRWLFSVYEQFFIPNQEHTVYNRFSREFAQYLYSGFLSLMKSDGNIQIPSFQNWKPDSNSGASFLNQASDITTKVFADGLITPFIKVINEKYLEDVTQWVHNTGRYTDAQWNIRVDTIPELITTKDALSTQIIKEGNDALEKLIDTYVEGNLSLDIPILVSRPFQKTITETDGRRRVTRTYNFVYDNYFYGTKANAIKSASDCSLIRGSTFGWVNTTVQMNHGYNMLASESDSKIIARDTDAGIACPNPTLSYWGGNSPLNSTYRGGDMVLNSSRSDDFALPVLDPAAGKKITWINSPLDCLKTDLILRPYQHEGIANKKYNWPTETNGNRYSCATPLQRPTPNPINIDPTPERNENILSNLIRCSGNNGDITLLDRDGKNLGTCQTNWLSWTYKRIPSLIKHSDPTTSIFGKQLQGLSTPNLPIDEERYLLYLNRTGTQSRVNYPNLFDIVVDPLDTDEIIVSKIRNALSPAQSQLTPRVNLPNGHKWSQLVPTSTLNSVNIADALLANAEIKNALVEALRWKYLDTETKYTSVFERALAPTTPSKNFILPDKKDLYETSYLGGQGDVRNFVFWFAPEKKNPLPEWFTNIEAVHSNVESDSSFSDSEIDSPYTLSPREISTLLGESDSPRADRDTEKDSTQSESGSSPKLDCELLSSVIVWEWLAQILCWLQWFTDEKSYTLTADTSDFPAFPFSTGGIGWLSGLLQQLKSFIKSDSNKNNVEDYVESNRQKISLNTTASARTMRPRETIRIDTTLDEWNLRLDDDSTNIRLEIIRIDDLDEKKSYSSRDTDWADIQKRYFTVSGSATLVDGHASWSFSSQNNNRARITFASRIYDDKGVLLSSEQDSVLIGPIALGVTVISSASTDTSQTLIAGDTRGLEVVLSGLDVYPPTVDVSIQDYVTGQEQWLYKSVPVTNNSIRLGSPAIDSVLRKSGKYTITVIAGDYSGQTYFMVSPDKPITLQANLSSILIRDTPEKVSFSLQDIWWNPLDLKDWNMNIKTSTKVKISPLSSEANTVFNGKASPITLTPSESGNTTFYITFTRGDQKIATNFSRPVLSDALLKVDIPENSVREVGNEIPVNFSIQRADGTLVDNWDTSIKIGIRGGDATLSQEILSFQWGRATTTLKTGTKPATISFYMKETGLGKIVGESLQVLPWEPARMTLASPETLFARPGARWSLTARVYDNYGNLTTLHGHSLVATSDRNALIQTLASFREVSVGIYETDIVSLGNPGRILFRAWLQKDGKKSPLSTLENVSETNALPVITSEEAAQNRWQNLTQVLLGAPFWQTPIEWYFGWSTLFASETKTLALTTLLDNSVTPVVTVMPTGALTTGAVQYGTGIKVSIDSYLNNSLVLSVSDSRLGKLVHIRYPAMSDISFDACEEVCTRDTITFTPAASDIYYREGSVYRNSEKLFNLVDVFSLPNLSLTFVQKNTQTLQFSVTTNGKNIGTISLAWKPRVPREFGVDTTGGIIVEPFLSTLLTKLTWNNMSSHEVPGMTIYMADTPRTYLGGAHAQWWSAYPESDGLGWTDDNTSLLQFASWQAWSESIENHADYLTINLGDPLIHLPNYGVDSSTWFDKTLGEPVYIWWSTVSEFTFRDANSDEKKDLIVYHDNGTIWMWLSRGDGAILDAGDLLSVRGAQQSMIRSWDFVGDGYADIIYIDTSGELYQIVHDENGPIEKPMQYDTTPIVWKIEQLEVFDMDYDSIDDIIVMDHLGSLFIFYGHSSGIFRVQLIDNVYDFVLSDEAKASYFTGAIRYNGPGFVDPNSMPKPASFELRTRQEQANNLIFTQIQVPLTQSTTITPVPSLWTAVTDSIAGNFTNSLSGLPNGLLRMYDGNATSLATSLRSGFNEFERENDATVSVITGDNQKYDTLHLLKAPFIIPSTLSVTKQYKSLEASEQVLSGSPIEVKIMLKNNSNQNISNILLLEKFAEYLSPSWVEYDIVRNTGKETRKFVIDSQESHSGIADLRNISLPRDESLTLVYTGTLKSFSFGKFDVGYLEDTQDPTSANAIPKAHIRSINTTASGKESIPESEFYNHDSYGDIRFNPNETCGWPIMLWRSHNTYDRTYHKTLITRVIPDAQQNALRLSADPTSRPANSRPVEALNADQQRAKSQTQLAEWNQDSDGDEIPDKDDNDYGDIFQMVIQNNIPQILSSLGKIDSVVADITGGIDQILKGFGSGFWNAISEPINWVSNMPGNTISALGYPVSSANIPPKACHKDVRCWQPIISFPPRPHEIWAGGKMDFLGWLPNVINTDGLNDDPDNTGSVTGKEAWEYTPGLGMSKFRVFLSTTLTGAMGQLVCFGPNNAIPNKPWMFPLRFDGNCIYAILDLLQGLNDGSDDKPLETETDVSDSLPPSEQNRRNPERGERTIISNASTCSSSQTIDAYPSTLSQSTANYFNNRNDRNTSALLQNISENSPVVNGSSSDSALELISQYGDDILKIALNPEVMNFLGGLWNPESINLQSVKAFPNFIMDWYQRQMDEITSSLTQFPDLNLALPHLSTLADPGAIPGLSGLQQGGGMPSIQSSWLLSSIIPNANAAFNLSDISSGQSIPPTIFSGAAQQFFESISQKTTVHPTMKRIDAEIPYANGPDIQKRLKEYEEALNAPQTPENASRLRQNIERLKEYQKLPERLQEAYYEKEKHLYGLSQNIEWTQKFMGDWMEDNGPKFNNWTESFVANRKMLGGWQGMIDVFNDYEAECWVNRNERWNLQHWMSIVIPEIIPNIPIIEMPRWPDFTGDYSQIDTSIDAEIPDYNLTFQPVSLPDAPIGTSAGPMPLIPKIPQLNTGIAPPSVDIPQLPDLPPAPKMPSLSPALKPALGIFNATTKFQCLYRKVPLAPEWVAWTKFAHKTERKWYLPFDFLDKDRGYPETYKKPQRFSLDINTIAVNAFRTVGDSDDSFDTLESSLKNLENVLQADTATYEPIAQIPSMIRELIVATQNPVYVEPRQDFADFSEIIQSMDMSPQRRSQFARILDTNIPQKNIVAPVLAQMNTRFERIQNAIEMDRQENDKIIQDLIAWSDNSKNLEDIPSLAQRIVGSRHLAQNRKQNSYLGALDSSILNPSVHVPVAIWSLQNIVPLVSVTADTPTAPSAQTTFASTVTEQGLRQAQWLYVTHGWKSQKLIYYADMVNSSTRIHTVDDDRDGDLDVYYSLWNIIYRKENYTQSRAQYIITDAPKVYTTRDIYRQFFNIRDTDMSQIPRDGQIFIKQNNSAGTVAYQVHMKEGNEHMRLSLFRSLFETRQNKGRYQVDIIPQAKNDPLMPISSVPTIADIDGTVFIEHNKIYRILLTKGQYTDENGSIQELSPEFVIRSGQSGYTSESTVVEVTTKGKTASYTMAAGQRLRFTSDSSVSIIKWSLILFSNTAEKRPLNIRDIGLPLLSNDRLITDTNGSASLIFPDGQETIIGPAQYWSLAEYAPGIGIKKLSLPVEPAWYYATITDARSLVENRFPMSVVFDAYASSSEGSILSNIPSQIRLSLPSPTEIDFQSYFPADTLEDVEIFRLPSSQYRKLSATKFAFETQEESTQIVVRVTLAWKKGDYTTRILTETPKLGINSVDQSGKVSGKTLSVSPILPLGIQSYIDNQSWTLARWFGSNGDIFSTSVVRNTPKISLNFWADALATFDRNSGVPTLGNTFSLAPLINIGQAPGYSVRQWNTERLRVRYDFAEMNFRQIATLEEINKSGIYVLGSWLRLEPATLRDALKGWAYITDTAYRPVVTLDNRGILRTLDTNVSWSVKIENNYVIFTLSRDRVELGKIIFTGDVITTLENIGV